MTIQQIHNVFAAYFTAEGISFHHGRESQINTLPITNTSFTYPMAVMDPISYRNIITGAQNHVRTYQVAIAFLNLLAIDRTSTQELAVVTAMEALCADFVQAMADNILDADNFDTSVMSGIEVQSVFWYKHAANNVAGVLLTFEIETIDTYQYCPTPTPPEPGVVAVVGAAIVGTSIVG